MIDYSLFAIRKPAPRAKRTGKGTIARLRAKKARRIAQDERVVKRAVRVDDGEQCRYPGCDVPRTSFWGQIDVAHYRAEGMGGDPQLRRCKPENLICLCKFHHTGPRGLHSGLLKMKPWTSRGMRGRVDFYERGQFIGATSPKGSE